MDPSAAKKPKLNDEEDLCPNLQACIDRWGLTAPYSSGNNNEKWGKYYAERALLEFRHTHFWDDKGEELACFKQCCGWSSNCREAEVEVSEKDGLKRCSCCKGLKKENAARTNFVEPTDTLKQAWTAELAKDPVLSDGAGVALPLMRQHCLESYATDCHSSGTTKGQYTDFIERIRGRVRATVASTVISNSFSNIADRVGAGVYILSYWANFEESAPKAQVRTVEFATRIYAPTGNGQSIDLHWRHHYRERMTMAPEKYCILHAQLRLFSDIQPLDPTKIFNWRKMDDEDALAILDGDTNENRVLKEFATVPRVKEYGCALFGEAEAPKISSRKIIALLARAAGAHVVGREAGWVYVGIRKRFELFPGEESDGEEKGEEDGPGCIIS